MKISRNEPCPCGSGKKYKKCCMLEEDRSRPSLTGTVLRAARDNAIATLLDYTDKHGILEEDLLHMGELFEVVKDNAEPAEQEAFFMQLALPWSLFGAHEDYTDAGVPKSAAHAFLQSDAESVDGKTRRFIQAALLEPLSFWQVEGLQLGSGLLMRDLFTDREVFLRDVSMSQSMTQWDIVLAQIVEMDGEHIINAVGVYPMDAHRFKAAIDREKDRILSGSVTYPAPPDYLLDYDLDFLSLYAACVKTMFDPSLPEIRNTDGEKLVTTRSRFDFQDREEILAGLSCMRNVHEDHEEDGKQTFVWLVKNKNSKLKQTLKGSVDVYKDHLVTECNSTNRDRRLRARLVKQFGETISFRETRKEPFDQTSALRQASKDHQDPMDLNGLPPEERNEIVAFLEEQFMSWADGSVPALGGKTPRDAAKTPAGRQQVADLVNGWENMHLHDSNRQFTFDFNKLRAELGLEIEA